MKKHVSIILISIFVLTLININLVFPQDTLNQNNQQRTFTNDQFNSRGRGIQNVDPRYQTNYNSGSTNYNQFGQQSYTPGYGGYGASGLFGYNNGFSNQLCQQGQNFLITIAPGGCTPAVVRSDLLEEQNVPVFCRLTSLQTNPFSSGTRIRSVRVSGQLPKGIQGVSYFPGRAAINQQSIFNRGFGGTGGFGNTAGNNYNYNQYNTGYSSYGANNNFGSNTGGFSGGGNFFNGNQNFGSSYQQSPITDNMGYIVVVLSRARNESSLPDFVEGNITATIDYDSAGQFGIGRTTFYLDPMNEEQWHRDYKKNGFWNGQAYIRANAVDQNTATISVYRDQNIVEQTLTLSPGQTSPVVQLGGNQCSGGMLIRLDQLSAPRESALLQINGEQLWVAKGDRIINNRCVVQNIISTGSGGKISINCPGSKLDLNLFGGKATFKQDGNPIDLQLNQKVPNTNIYLGYIGKDNDGNDFAVLVQDGISNSQESFADKEVYSAVERADDKTDEDKIKDEIIKTYKAKGNTINVDQIEIQIAKTNQTAFGISLINLFTIQDQQDFNKNPIAQVYYDRAISYYRELFDLYPNEKIAEGETPLAAKGLSEAFELSRQFQMNEQAQEFSQKITDNYPNTPIYESIQTESNYLFKYDRTNARAIAQVDNNQYSIDLLEFRKPSRIDASAIFIIDGKEEILGIGGFYTSNNTRIQLLDLNNDRAIIGYDYTDNNGNNIRRQETLIFGDRSQTSINEIIVKLTNINLKKQAKVTILPNLYGSGSRNQVNFPVRIGIEKRAIQLSPEKTKDLIKNLQDAIDSWNKINKKLGTVIKTLKAACFATSAILTVKNLFESATGKAIARSRIMKASGGWNDKCEELVNDGEYNSIQQCLLDKNPTIENDIKIFSEQIQGTNGKLKDIQERVGIDYDSPFDFQGQTDAREVEKLFNEEQFSPFCKDNNNQIQLPGQGADSISYSEICDWKGMTHEQRREILTLSNIKEQGGSEVLQNYANRELGRITLDAKNTHEARIAQIISAENSNKFNLDLKTINPIGDQITHGPIKTITNADRGRGNAYQHFGDKESIVRIYIPEKQEFGQTAFEGGNVGGKEVLVKVNEIDGSGGVFSPDKETKIVGIDGTIYRSDSEEAIAVREYMSLSKLNKIKQADTKAFKNQMVDTENLRVKFFDRAPFKGLPSIVPFDIKEGWYVKTSYTLSGFGVPYDESGRAANYYICNVGSNGLIEFKKSSDDICRYYNGFNRDLSFPGMNPGESAQLVQRAQAALQDASRQFGRDNININGQTFKSGVSFDETDGQCTDFMSAQDCNILFNVCDPVICPPSRCDLGGDYRVDNVIQTGIVGSLALCLPNAQEGIAVPICLTGVHAGLDGYISILNSTVACLSESLETGQNIGICDEIKSVYLCDFFWRQATPFLEVLLQKAFTVAAGEGARGGGEYLTVQNAWQNTENAVNYFTGQYAGNSIQAFQNRNLGGTQPISSFGSGAYGGVGFQGGNAGYNNGHQSQLGTPGSTGQSAGASSGFGGNVGGDFCKSFISSGFSGSASNLFESLIEPDSPEQYTAWVSEHPLSTATLPPTSHYKVYYHIFAGKDIGASYQVYLRGAPQTPGIFSNQFRIVDQGYIARGSEVDQAKDFTAVSGFQELCININGREECGFGSVTTSYLLNSITDKYAEEQAGQTDIVSEKNCIAGSPSLYSLAQPNIQAGVEDVLDPQLYNKGIVRICSTENPGKQVLPSGEYDKTNTLYDKWKDVGYCDDPTIRCWLDTSSVQDVIKNTGIENQVLGNVNLNALGGGNFIIPEEANAVLSEAQDLVGRGGNGLLRQTLIKPGDSQQSIDNKIANIVYRLETLSVTGPNNLFRARAYYSLANIHKVIAEIVFISPPVEVVTPISESDKETPVEEEIQEDYDDKLLRGEGLTIKKTIRIDKRVFKPINGEGYVKIVNKGTFLVKNVKIITGEEIEITTPNVNTYIIFVEKDFKSVIANPTDNYIQIVGKNGYKEIQVRRKKFKIDYDSRNPPKFVLDNKGNLANGTKYSKYNK